MRLVTTSKAECRTPACLVTRAVLAAGVLITFTAGIAYLRAAAWAGGLRPGQVSDKAGQAYYQNVFTLVDLPSGQLVQSLPELEGLLPSASQEKLPRLMAALGKTIKESYQKFSEVVAREQVTQVQCSGRQRAIAHHKFSYLIIPHHEAGVERLEELRTGIDGKPALPSEIGTLVTQGFAPLWILFYPENQSGSRFRYLGVQRLGSQSANVIGFAQEPSLSIASGVAYMPGGQPVVMLYQGVAWVDATTNRILKLRTDLLKPRLDVKLELQTTEIQFGEVRLKDLVSTVLWLPLRVDLTVVWDGRIFREEHLYSDYRLPGATSVIKSAPPG